MDVGRLYDFPRCPVLFVRLDQIALLCIIILPISKILRIKRFTGNLQFICQTTIYVVCSDLLLDEDWSGRSVVVLLDISAVLDTVDRTIIINRLERRAGVTDAALQWLRSYFFNISLYHWSPANVPHGVSQGSILSPHSVLH